MNVTRCSWVTQAVLLALLVGWTTNGLALGSKLHAIEYDIISAAINHGAGSDSGKIIIDDTTATALREWSRLNNRRYTLQSNINTASAHELLSQQSRSAVFNNSDPGKNWQQFNAKFPGSTGILRISRPGIDDTAKTALIYMEFECGTQCGSGRLVNLVQRPSGNWNVVSATLLWITSPE
jgi:hypothetical protein